MIRPFQAVRCKQIRASGGVAHGVWPGSKMEDPLTRKPVSEAREVALRALVRVERDRSFLNLVLPVLLRPLSPREAALASRIAAGTVQRLNTLDWALQHHLQRSLSSLTPWVRNILRSGAYQILYLERIPAAAAVDEAVRLAYRFGHRGVAGLVNASLRSLARFAPTLPWPDREKEPVNFLSLKHSHPVWMVKRWLERYGVAETEALCTANNSTAPLSIRPNRLRLDRQGLLDQLNAMGVRALPSPLVKAAVRLPGRVNPAALACFQDGYCTVQGESAMLVAPALGPRPGETVVDLCSAPGGKTTHLAELMEDRGRILAIDFNPKRLRLVEQAARRLGLHCITTIAGDGRAPASLKLPVPDRILVDAPCSGLGVIRRRPDLKWRRRPEDIPVMQCLQLELLRAAAGLLAPGGILVYSVCSNETEETRAVAEIITRTEPSLEPEAIPSLLLRPELSSPERLAGRLDLYPHRHGMDGFFIARWRKG